MAQIVTQQKKMSEEMRQCLQNCQDCHSICLQTLQYCLEQGGRHIEPAHLKLLQDCAEHCQTCSNFMLRGSAFHTKVCGVCAEICTRCAESCEKLADDPQMKACAETCRRCAETCKKMGSMRS